MKMEPFVLLVFVPKFTAFFSQLALFPSKPSVLGVQKSHFLGELISGAVTMNSVIVSERAVITKPLQIASRSFLLACF